MDETILFNRTYNVCPRFPQGTKWEAGFSGRNGSSMWNMVTFNAALDYVRTQYKHAVEATKARRHPGDQYCEQEFRGFIDGPGGRIDWHTLKPLVVNG